MNYYIVNNASRAATYGIGTYVKQLTEILAHLPDVKVYHIDLYADKEEFTVEQDDTGVTHYAVPAIKSHIETEAYCRTVFYLLSPYLPKTGNSIFHFNYFQHYALALALKAQNIQNRIFLTVHYFNWCFELKGNTTQFRQAIHGEEPDEKQMRIRKDFAESRTFLRLADNVIALSKFCKNLLKSDYGISPEKVRLVYNGLGTALPHAESRQEANAPVILYVGRLDEIKGVKYLIEAFRKVVALHPEARLVMVGDGDYNECLEQAKDIWYNLTFTGRISKEDLCALYERTIFGVLPSFHEQCSYAAIEFMQQGIPFIGTDSTGLGEMLDAVPELRVHIEEEQFSEEQFVDELAKRMNLLLSDEKLRERAGCAMSNQYERLFTKEAMARNMCKTIEEDTQRSTSLSKDFLYVLDDYMISLIHNQPDIDTEYYGATGIGVYLWWRIAQLDESEAEEARCFKIKEYLIYYLDRMYELLMNEGAPQCCRGLAFLLRRMERDRFYSTRIATLTRILRCPPIETTDSYEPQAEDILANSVRMINTKI